MDSDNQNEVYSDPHDYVTRSSSRPSEIATMARDCYLFSTTRPSSMHLNFSHPTASRSSSCRPSAERSSSASTKDMRHEAKPYSRSSTAQSSTGRSKAVRFKAPTNERDEDQRGRSQIRTNVPQHNGKPWLLEMDPPSTTASGERSLVHGPKDRHTDKQGRSLMNESLSRARSNFWGITKEQDAPKIKASHVEDSEPSSEPAETRSKTWAASNRAQSRSSRKSQARSTRPRSLRQSSHPHPQMNEDFRQGKRFKRGSYAVQDIPSAIKENCQRPLSRRLTAGSWAILNASTKARSRDSRKKMLQQWSVVFDEAFFFGSLLDRIAEIQFTGVEVGMYGHYEHSGSGLCISLDEERPWQYEGTDEQHMICTLVHEMLHAFFDVYGCTCAECREVEHPSEGPNGSGHGPNWADSMKLIEDSLQEVVKWPVYTGIASGVQQSMREEKWQPTGSQIDRWNAISPFYPNRSGVNNSPQKKACSDDEEGEDGVSHISATPQGRRRTRSPGHRRVHQIAGHKVPELVIPAQDDACAIM
jgi:hypothetical protein